MVQDIILKEVRNLKNLKNFKNEISNALVNTLETKTKRYKANKSDKNKHDLLATTMMIKRLAKAGPLHPGFKQGNKSLKNLRLFVESENVRIKNAQISKELKKKVEDFNNKKTVNIKIDGPLINDPSGKYKCNVSNVEYVFNNIDVSDDSEVYLIKTTFVDGTENIKTINNKMTIKYEMDTERYELGKGDKIETSWGDECLISSKLDIKEIFIFHHKKRQMFKNYNFEEDEGDSIELSRENKAGAFFKYTTEGKIQDIDLSRYQIFNKLDHVNFEENCLVYALSKCEEVTKEVINHVKTICRNNMIPKKAIKEIAENNNLNITVKYINCGRNDYYNPKGTIKIVLGLIDEHYFICDNKPTITTYAIDNYDRVINFKKWNQIKGFRKNGNPIYADCGSNSFLVVQALLRNKDKLLKKIIVSDELLKSVNYGKNTKIESLGYNEDNLKPIVHKDKLTKFEYRCDFDFETCLNKNNVTAPYLVNSCILRVGTPDVFLCRITNTGENCGFDMLESLCVYLNNIHTDKDKSIRVCLMAHNISYDIKFLVKHIMKYTPCHRSSENICGGSGLYYPSYYNRNLKPLHLSFKCSYAVIPKKLSAFGDMFNLDVKKEIMPYGVYTYENAFNDNASVNVADCFHNEDNQYDNRLLNSKDKAGFIDNINKWNLWADKEHKKFYHNKYSKKYCEMDVKVMSAGYAKFKNWLLSGFGLNIDNYATICSFADAYLKKEGCYEGVYSMSGVPMLYINQAMRGGRCMLRDNKKSTSYDPKTKTHIKFNDFDAVSLYPSAMYRMDGFLKGKPKILTNEQLNKQFLDTVDGYFVTIKITKVNKRLHMPIISILDNEGNRLNTNDVNPDLEIVVDKVTLEDWERFQQIEYVIIKGYYFNEGRNKKINDVILSMFNKRVQYKKEENAIEEVYKLLMNSSYGKTLLKPEDTKYVYMDNRTKMMNYVTRNYNFIKDVTKYHDCDKHRITVQKPINDHFNAVHVGVEILSMSKRITHEVMALAEDLNIRIDYTDTDSMHIENDKVELLATEFKKIYGRDLIGSKMGQFHNDFAKLEIGTDDKGKKIYKEADYAVESIFLSKKIYADKVQYTVGDNILYKYHYRLKGVPSKVVQKKADEEFKGDIMALYNHMYNSNKVEFDLLSCGFRIESNKNMSITNNDSMTRKILIK